MSMCNLLEYSKNYRKTTGSEIITEMNQVIPWLQGGEGGRWVRPTPPFEICAPFFKNKKIKIMKNWEKLSESGQLYVQAEERKHKYKYSS